ncbi:Uncharacterised protein [Streptococcus acidominimus]|uniref:Uncharacterized protein n=1 Tax=Streptococcus acidominimus TaxID=1326 RepID=A0A380IIA4_STRAI|nr:Uncharacterised protein [Streptococcus acidominimus]
MNHKTKKMGIFILGILVGLLLTPFVRQPIVSLLEYLFG